MAQEFLNGLEAAAHIMYCLTKRFVLAFYPAFHSNDKAFIKLKWYRLFRVPGIFPSLTSRVPGCYGNYFGNTKKAGPC
jgi:hypothetical protein